MSEQGGLRFTRAEAGVVVKVDEAGYAHARRANIESACFATHDGGTTSSTKSRRTSLPEWLAASKAALAASCADHRETQRRISSLQEITKGLSIVDHTDQNRHQISTKTTSGRSCDRADRKMPDNNNVDDDNGSIKRRCPVPQMHCMAPAIIGEVVSFLEPQTVLTYSMTCTAAESALWQDECWRGISDVRHLDTIAADAAPPFAAIETTRACSSSAPPPLLSSLGEKPDNDAVVKDCSKAPIRHETGSRDNAADSPLRRAVIAHGRVLSQALRLFEMVVADGGASKAVINGPTRTVAAVASLQALVEISANVRDPVARKTFVNLRTGQVLLSILAREHSSAVLQELACAVLANLFCHPDTRSGDFSTEQATDLCTPESAAAETILGRNEGAAIQALTSLCSSTRPPPSSWFTSKHSVGGGMRPVENLPGRQASRALLNILLPHCQVRQQQGKLLKGVTNDHQSALRRRGRGLSLPVLPPPTKRLQRVATSTELFPLEGPDPVIEGEKESGTRPVEQPLASTAWEERTKDGTSRALNSAAIRPLPIRSDGCAQAVENRVKLPPVTVPATAASPAHLSTGRAVVEDGRTASTAAAAPNNETEARCVAQSITTRTTKATGKSGWLSEAATKSRTAPFLPSSPRLLASATPRPGAGNGGSPLRDELGLQDCEPLPPATAETSFAVHSKGHDTTRPVDHRLPSAAMNSPEACMPVTGGRQEEEWEAFYFYHGGGMKDKFIITLSPGKRPGCFCGRGADKLGPFVMEGTPLLDPGGDETWFMAKTYTGRGSSEAAAGGGSTGAHVTHTAYRTKELPVCGGGSGDRGIHLGQGTRGPSFEAKTTAAAAAAATTAVGGSACRRNHHRPATDVSVAQTSKALRSFQGAGTSASLLSDTTSRRRRHLGFWGVWEPVLGRAGDRGGVTGGSIGSAASDRWKTTLSRRGGAFRLVPLCRS